MNAPRGPGMSHHLSGVPKDARRYQGRPAGIVTRLVAAGVDVVVVLVIVAVGVLLVNAAVLAARPLAFEPILLPLPLRLVTGLVVAVAYLAAAWASTGRTFGAAVLGIRVVDASLRVRLPVVRAVVRAASCTIFPIGLLWTLVSSDRRSLHDRLTGSAVVYDWSPSG